MLGWILAGLFGILSGIALALFLRAKGIRDIINGYLKENLSKDIGEDKKIEVESVIKNYRKYYKQNNKGKTAKSVSGIGGKAKFKLIDSYLATIMAVATVFNPNEKDAYLNFSLKGGFDFLRKVLDDIEDVLNNSKIFSIKGLNVSIVMASLKIAIGIKSNKIVEVGSHAVKGAGKVSRIINLINPFYWIRKATLAIFISMATNELALAVVDIVAWEFANFYNKSVKEIEKSN